MPLEIFSLAGRRALVTGASRGIGRAIALGLAGAGADLALAARSGEALRSVADDVAGLGRKAVAITMDVSHVPDCRRAAAEAADVADLFLLEMAFEGVV